MPELIVSQNGKQVFRLPLDSKQIEVGRSNQNDLILSGEEVSRHHAILKQKENKFWIIDRSSAGTYVNGAKVQGEACLEDQSRISIAGWELVYQKNSSEYDAENQQRSTQIARLAEEIQNDGTRLLRFEPTGKIKHIRAMLAIDDAGSGRRHFIVKQKHLTIGSGADCDVVLKDPFVSKKHAEIRLSDHGFLLTDLNSTNGTIVNGTKIREGYVTKDQEFTLGKSKIWVNFKSESEGDVAAFGEDHFCGIYGKSHEMRMLFGRIQVVAGTDMTVLVQGETGSGKEMVARAIHDLSSRKDKPYIILNCGAISANLIESELFGHERGAFTGADQRHIGVFEQASGGTLFLDEIGELPLEMQAKILRVLEYQTLRRVGGTQDIKVDVRLIAATHRDLIRMVGENKFREDLFFRLYVLPLRVPPLRERREDIEILSQIFIKKFSRANGIFLSDEALDKLKKHSWPGNVRELKNTIMRTLAFLKGSTILVQDIEVVKMPVVAFVNETSPSLPAHSTTDVIAPTAVDQFERERIMKAIERSCGDKAAAAQMLGIGRSTLFRRIKELGIERD